MNKTAELLERSNFSELPFHPVPRADHAIWAGSLETRDELLRVINEVKPDSVELSHLVLVYGEYGSGKTHALKYLTSKLKGNGSFITAYLEKPKVERKASFHGIVKEVIKQIGERPLRKAVEPLVTYIKTEAKRQAATTDLTTVDGSLDLHVQRVTDDVKRNLQEELNPQFPELLDLFQGLVEEDPNAWRYFTGKPTAASLSKYHLTAPMEDDHDALRVLSGIYRVLTTKYPQIANTPVYDAAYLFVDEMESLLDMKSDEIISIRTGFRDLFNACTEHFCLILASTAENASLFHGLLEEALMVRITAEPVHIVSHDEVADGVRFVRDLLEHYRAGTPPTPYHPFTEEGLSNLVERTGLPRTARKLITNCRRAWEQSSDLILTGGSIGPDDVDGLVGLV
jgi:uncharacterized protein YqgV (UPF0045/DUF77 family)